MHGSTVNGVVLHTSITVAARKGRGGRNRHASAAGKGGGGHSASAQASGVVMLKVQEVKVSNSPNALLLWDDGSQVGLLCRESGIER